MTVTTCSNVDVTTVNSRQDDYIIAKSGQWLDSTSLAVVQIPPQLISTSSAALNCYLATYQTVE